MTTDVVAETARPSSYPPGGRESGINAALLLEAALGNRFPDASSRAGLRPVDCGLFPCHAPLWLPRSHRLRLLGPSPLPVQGSVMAGPG